MAMPSVGPGAHVLDLTAVGSSRELTEIDGRLHVLEGLLDALGRIEDVNRTIQLTANKRAAAAALQQEPFGYSERQAEAVLEMPMSWQCAESSQRLRAEHTNLAARRAEVREKVSEILSLHWFG
jgi:DNA gyrase/topoisomerase IV subunit A